MFLGTEPRKERKSRSRPRQTIDDGGNDDLILLSPSYWASPFLFLSSCVPKWERHDVFGMVLGAGTLPYHPLHYHTLFTRLIKAGIARYERWKMRVVGGLRDQVFVCCFSFQRRTLCIFCWQRKTTEYSYNPWGSCGFLFATVQSKYLNNVWFFSFFRFFSFREQSFGDTRFHRVDWIRSEKVWIVFQIKSIFFSFFGFMEIRRTKFYRTMRGADEWPIILWYYLKPLWRFSGNLTWTLMFWSWSFFRSCCCTPQIPKTNPPKNHHNDDSCMVAGDGSRTTTGELDDSSSSIFHDNE